MESVSSMQLNSRDTLIEIEIDGKMIIERAKWGLFDNEFKILKKKYEIEMND